MIEDTLSYNTLVDDYIRLDNEHCACKDSLKIEKKARKSSDLALNKCKEDKAITKKKVFVNSLKRTAIDLLIGLALGFLATNLL